MHQFDGLLPWGKTQRGLRVRGMVHRLLKVLPLFRVAASARPTCTLHQTNQSIIMIESVILVSFIGF